MKVSFSNNNQQNEIIAATDLATTGLADLDSMLGGGLEDKSLMLIGTDRIAKYGVLISEFFLASGILSPQRDRIFSASQYPILGNLFGISARECESRNEITNMKIAWRYNDLKTRTPRKTGKFSLSEKMPKEAINREGVYSFETKNKSLEELLASIHQKLREWGSAYPVKLYVRDPGNSSWPGASLEHLSGFLGRLKDLMQSHGGIISACVTVPAYMLQENEMRILALFADYCFEVKSLLDARELNGDYLSIYDGFIHFLKGRRHGWESLGFKVRKRGVSISTVTTLPEGLSREGRSHSGRLEVEGTFCGH